MNSYIFEFKFFQFDSYSSAVFQSILDSLNNYNGIAALPEVLTFGILILDSLDNYNGIATLPEVLTFGILILDSLDNYNVLPPYQKF